MPDRLKAEAISPIQNKVGQFVTSKMIRNIIGKTKSSIDLEQIMKDWFTVNPGWIAFADGKNWNIFW